MFLDHFFDLYLCFYTSITVFLMLSLADE